MQKLIVGNLKMSAKGGSAYGGNLTKLIVGNLKMNLLSIAERDKYLEAFNKEVKLLGTNELNLVLCPPAVYLESFAKKLKSKSVAVGAQNIFGEQAGSYTGEMSAPMISSVGAKYVIVGHSERRKYFGETNANANAKIKAALQNGLSPIYCVGETKEEKENETAAQVIAEQIIEGFADIQANDAVKIVIAYEPVWAIGGSSVPTSDEIWAIKILLKKILAEKFDLQTAQQISVLYGGSVNAATAQQVCLEPNMDGVLIGRESLQPKEFIKIAKIINAIK